MPPSDAAGSTGPDDFDNRNAFLDCLLGVIGLCERTVNALADQTVDPPDVAPATAHGSTEVRGKGPMLR